MAEELTTHIYIADSAGPQSAADARLSAAAFMRITEENPEAVFETLVDFQDFLVNGRPAGELQVDDARKTIIERVSGLLALTSDGKDIEFDGETEMAMYTDPDMTRYGDDVIAAQGRAEFSKLRRRASVGALAFYASRVAEQRPRVPHNEVA
jgi:hypothetical protein